MYGMTAPIELKTSKRKSGMLIICMFLAALVCYGQIKNSYLFLSAGLFAFLGLSALSCSNGTAFPFLLFFLPWSPLLKFQNGGISFFTIALLIICVFYFLKNKMFLSVYQIIFTALLMGLTLIAKVLHGGFFDNNYVFFFAMLLLFPCITRVNNRSASFEESTIFFMFGIITAALSAQKFAGYPNISKYIVVHSYLTITRLSGYYGDPNFYSAHICSCLAGIQILLTFEKSRRKQLALGVFSIVLIYCGLLSASKSFIIVTACLFLVWIPILLGKNNRNSAKFRLFVGILCAIVIILSSSLFQNLLQMVNNRFAYASNVSELTTGRTELWLNYFNEFKTNVLLLLFGEGYTDVKLNGRASHNTIIQGVFQFGIIGFSLVLGWLCCTLKNVVLRTGKTKKIGKYVALMCVGVALPWMALDILFFDEFFLLPVYAVLGISYAAEASQ